MDSKELRLIKEAYASIYEGYGKEMEDEMEDDEECGDKEETPKMKGKKKEKKEKENEMKEEVDLFDYLLEYLVAEGYADTNKSALAIMANMSEEWRQSIVEGWIGQTADNVARAAGTVVGTVEKGVDTLKQKVQNVKGTFDYARDRARDNAPSSSMIKKPAPAKPAPPSAKKRSREFDKELPFGVNPGGPDFGR